MRLWPRRKVYVDDLPKTHDLRFAIAFVIIFVVVLGSLYAVGHVLAGDRVPAGTTVAGVDIGSMTAGQARTVLQTELVPRIEKPVKATVGGRTFVLDPQETGLTLDIEATVDEALGGGSWDPRHMLHVLTGGGEVDPVIVVDTDEMAVVLTRISSKVQREAVDARVFFTAGRPQIRYGESGRALDTDAATARLRSALLGRDGEVSLSLSAVEPDVTSTEATRFVSGVANPATAAPIRLRVADTVVSVPTRVFSPALHAEAGDGRLRLTVDQEALFGRSKSLLAELPQQPRSAKIKFVEGRVVIRPSQVGVGVSKEAWASAALKALTRQGDTRRASVRTSEMQPGLTTQEARMLEIRQPVASRVVRYDERVSGDGTLLARQLNRLLMRPGASVSVRDRLDTGPDRRPASLLATATYDAAFRAGLTIVERTPSPFYVHSSTPGLDAELLSPGSDLVLRNDAPYGVLVRAYVASVQGRIGELHVELWSTPYLNVRVRSSDRYGVVNFDVIENSGRRCMPRPGSDGFDIDVRRVLARGSGPGRTETTHTRYEPLAAVRCIPAR